MLIVFVPDREIAESFWIWARDIRRKHRCCGLMGSSFTGLVEVVHHS
jgi:hypothetical protein